MELPEVCCTFNRTLDIGLSTETWNQVIFFWTRIWFLKFRTSAWQECLALTTQKSILSSWLGHCKQLVSYHRIHSRNIDGRLTWQRLLFLVHYSGYMAPESMGGVFSMKSDVFSFGVLVLEIIAGKKNRAVYGHSDNLNLLSYVSIRISHHFYSSIK